MKIADLEKRILVLEDKVRTLEKLEKRVQVLEDSEEIKKLHTNYIYALGEHKWEEMIDCFSNDAVAHIEIHGEQKGKGAIAKSFREDIAKVASYQKGGQMLIQPVINVNGDNAQGCWTMFRFNQEFRSASGQYIKLFGPEIQGKYDTEYVKENGKWKFSRLKFTRPWPKQNPEAK